ncbi:hypothetical protein N0V93_002650 [Gnomoniopsis smithogilvyi]|uniref:Uncharacterized protein n=1 Tax=Gnomoniopsis smithogilvyi TaxID=1191159 RepID=A0A9W8YZ88_9PEZI|nr:hypothetical protein N0V93_002650 [Gnomoniopsis smithogilvyi]
MRSRLIQRLLPKFARGEPRWRMCWDNHTPTEDLLLCEHPQVKNLFIITGGSFNGYKFMPNIGKYMINILKRQSNGTEMDKAWGWKSKDDLKASNWGLITERMELNDLDENPTSNL